MTKSVKLKIAEGAYIKDPQRRRTNPEPPVGIPEPPKWLRREGKAEWRRICQELETMTAISKVDRAALEQYCSNYEIWLECTKKLKEEGTTTVGSMGSTVEHPLCKQHREYGKMCQKMLSEFGLTIASRSRLHVTQQPEADPLEEAYFGSVGIRS